MSTFILYNSNDKSLKRIKIINRIFFIFGAILISIFGLLGKLWDWTGFSESYFIIVILIWIVLFVSFLFYSRRNDRKLTRTGELITSMEGIIKNVNNEKEFIEYEKINNIKVRNFFLTPILPANNEGSKSYLITIEKENSLSEKLIISSQSIDKPETNFKDAIKVIRKFRKINFKTT